MKRATAPMLALLLALLLALPAGCYSIALDEFDSAARWDDPLKEPTEIVWSSRPTRYPWYFFLGASAQPADVDNPSGFARERLETLIDEMGSDLSRTAQVSRRMLWVAALDPNPFNRITALRGMEFVLLWLGVDVLDPAMYYSEPDHSQGALLDARLRSAQQTVELLLHRAGHRALTVEERNRYLAALRTYTEQPLPRDNWRRTLIRATWSVFVAEPDPIVRDAARLALRRAIGFAVCNGLRSALVPLDHDDFPAVRIEALHVYRRVGGIPAVPFVLRTMARPQYGSHQQRYDRDPKVRLELVRLCAQLRLMFAERGDRDGPRPIEFLYETAVDEEEEDGIRRVALEGLWRTVGGRDPIVFDTDAAKEWWKQYVASRRRP